MAAIDPTQTAARLRFLNGLASSQKGSAFEELVAEIFAAIPGCDLVISRARDVAVAREIDLGFRVDPQSPVSSSFGTEMLIECKHLASLVSPMQIRWFVEKLEKAQQRSGVLVCTLGITGSQGALTGAARIIDEARSSGVSLAVVVAEELLRLRSGEQLADLLHRKIYIVKTTGHVWLADDDSMGQLVGGQAAGKRPLGDPGLLAHALTSSAERVVPTDPVLSRSGNARSLSNEELAATFVAPSAFWRLARPSHSLVIGTRGSGRTTLLRMLTPAPLQLFGERLGRNLREEIDYIGIWVDGRTRDHGRSGTAVHSHLVLLDVISATLSAVRQQLGLLGVSQEVERQAVAAFNAVLRVAPEPDSLRALEHEVSVLRASVLWARDADDLDDRDDIFSLVATLLHRVNGAIGRPRQRWCLLFDELELADWRVAAQVLTAMRGSDPSLLVKAAVLPYMANSAFDSGFAAALHDYDVVGLDTRQSEASMAFMTALADREVRTVMGADATLKSALGGSATTALGALSQEATLPQAIEELREKDASFASWLAACDDGTRNAFIRKALPIIQIRNARTQASGAQRARVASAELWAGAYAVLLAADGNPRRLLAMLRDMLESADGPRVTRGAQAEALARQSATILNAIAAPAQGAGDDPRALVDAIGRHFGDRVLAPRFDPDPPLTITVDDDLPDVLRRSLDISVNLGALRVVGDPLTAVTVRRERLRLTYALAPRYGLPPRLGRSVNLQTVLQSSDEASAQTRLML